MIKFSLVLFLLFGFLNARENPFFPAKGEKDIPYTSNKLESISSLDCSSITLPSSARIIKKVTIEYENLDASINSKEMVLNKSIDWHLPIYLSQVKTALPKNYNKFLSNKYITVSGYENSIKLVTKDKLIRDFLLVKPRRIVLDLKRDTNLKSYMKNFSKSIVKRVKIGNHTGYYRIVLELDGPYIYKIKKTLLGYIITLN